MYGTLAHGNGLLQRTEAQDLRNRKAGATDQDDRLKDWGTKGILGQGNNKSVKDDSTEDVNNHTC